MSEDERYEELRKYFEGAEAREQGYIVTITNQIIRIKELEKRLEVMEMQGRIPRKVTQLDYETGEVIAVFQNIEEAAEVNKLVNSEAIRKGFMRHNGKLPTKHLWFRYFTEGDEIMSAKKVRQLDYETGEVIDVYDSLTEAAEDNYTTFEVLSHALRKNKGILPQLELRFEYV